MSGLLIDREADALLLIDLQPDFMPGGALAVPDGDAVSAVVADLLRDRFLHAVATQDWHPPGHVSFASSHPGQAAFSQIETPDGLQTLWPDHCVQGTPGAALDPRLDGGQIELVVRKGFRSRIDSYSAFRENDRRTTTGLAAWLQARGFRRVFLCGLAFDFCVLWSAIDAVAAGFETLVIEDACRGIALPAGSGRTSMDDAAESMARHGVRVVSSRDLASGQMRRPLVKAARSPDS